MLNALERTRRHAEPTASSFLCDQVAALLCYDPSVRSGGQDAASAMSAAAGRVWSVLGDRKLFDRAAVDALHTELNWLTQALAPLGRSAPAHEAAYDTALAALESERYFQLVADLQQFCSAPPVRQPRRWHLYLG
jgi:hypothetical protein